MNLIVKKPYFNTLKLEYGDAMKLHSAKIMTLKSGKPCYLIEDLQVVNSKSKSVNLNLQNMNLQTPKQVQPQIPAQPLFSLANLTPYNNLETLAFQFRLIKKYEIKEWKNE